MTEYPAEKLATLVESEISEQKTPALDPVSLQNQLMQFADSYATATVGAAAKLREHGERADPMRLLRLKLEYSEDVYQIATGPNPLANLLDMIVLVSMTRMQLQEHWIPEVWGASAQTLLNVMLQQEKAIWALAGDALTPDKQQELRRALKAWQADNRRLRTLAEVRATGFAATVAKYGAPDKSAAGSVFDLLQIDPLAALDPATEEIERTRHFAERALFLAQRMPTLLRWQSELLGMALTRLPEVHALLGDTHRISDAAERLSRTAEQLPSDIARERQLVLDALQMQSGPLTTLTTRVQQALQAGTEMAQSTDATLKTFDHVYADLRAGPKDPDAKPFRIEDYKEMAGQIAVTAVELNQLLKSVDDLASSPSTSAERRQLSDLAQDLQRRGDELLTRMFKLGAFLIMLFFAALLLTLLAYRVMASRLTPLYGRTAWPAAAAPAGTNEPDTMN